MHTLHIEIPWCLEDHAHIKITCAWKTMHTLHIEIPWCLEDRAHIEIIYCLEDHAYIVTPWCLEDHAQTKVTYCLERLKVVLYGMMEKIDQNERKTSENYPEERDQESWISWKYYCIEG